MNTPVEVLDANGEWLPATAVSGVEPTHVGRRKIHDFPVVWVRFRPGSERPMPWPAEDVRWPGGSPGCPATPADVPTGPPGASEGHP